jgi:hypothetical protein
VHLLPASALPAFASRAFAGVIHKIGTVRPAMKSDTAFMAIACQSTCSGGKQRYARLRPEGDLFLVSRYETFVSKRKGRNNRRALCREG